MSRRSASRLSRVVARRPPRRALLLMIVALASVGSVTAAATLFDGVADLPDRQAVRVEPPRPAVVIGDSAISALRWVPNAENAVVGFSHTLDLESCRRLHQLSCRGREGRRPPTVYEALLEHGRKYRVLVVATGYNDGQRGFPESFERVVGRARDLGYDQIVWWTLRSDVDYVSPGSIGDHLTFAANNRTLRDLVATGDYPDVVLADWGEYTADRPEWFATDGVHYRAVGAWAASDYLSRKMAYLERRPCPVPVNPSEPVADPCPDPDVTGPVADIEALYPVGDDGVLCYEIGEQRVFECRLDTHVLQLTRELGPGMSGNDVAALQTRLNRLGLLGAPPSGSYGSQTTSAVRGFQASVSLPATGTADVATLSALGFDTGGIG